MNALRCTPEDYIYFLVGSPGPVSCTEAARVQPESPFAPAHDSFTRLLRDQEPDPEELWREAEPLVRGRRGRLVIDDSTLGKPYAKKIDLVTRHWSGKHHKTVRGINVITLLWTDGDLKVPVDYRVFLKQVRDFGWFWQTRLRGDRVVTPDDRVARPLDAVAVSASGTVLHLRGYGLIKVFRIDAPDGDTEYWATNDLAMDEGMRLHNAEVSFAIENYHRESKQFCGVEKCQARSERAQRNHIGMALRAFLRLEWHFFTTGVSPQTSVM